VTAGCNARSDRYNILLRTLQPANSHCAVAQRAINLLRSRRETLWVCAQNIVEFWAVATRPLQDNGLGFSISRALQEVAAIKQHFPVLSETPLLPAWESLVSSHQVIGRSVHDARLVAAMIQHGTKPGDGREVHVVFSVALANR
jgi:hypothetical protein